jgi:sortase A
MKDRRTVDQLSVEELEEILRIRRREQRVERLRRLGKDAEGETRDPLAADGSMTASAGSPVDHRRFEGEGATADYRVHELEDERPGESGAQEAVERERRPIRWDWVRDKGLLVIEVGLVAALILVVGSLLATLHGLNEAARGAQEGLLPNQTPTPLIQVVILPGGHSPPDSPGGPAPQDIPEHLRDLVGALIPPPIPTRGPEQAIRIQIPSIGVDAPVVEGDDWEALMQGAGHHIGSANPGTTGNCVISAHNDIFGEVFRDLPELDLGAEVLLHTASNVYRYVVDQKRIIEPTDVSVMYPASSPVLTLISCYPYGIDTHRVAVIAHLQF